MKREGIHRRTMVRVIAYGAAAFLVLGGFTFQLWQERQRLERYVEADYQHNFAELVEGMSAIEHALQKELYSTSPVLVSQLSNEVARVSAGAQSMMAGLPFAFEELEETARFLSQLGDWSASLARAAAAGERLSEEQRNTIKNLGGNARSLAARLVELQSIINEENLQISAVLRSEKSLEPDEPSLFGGVFKEFAAELSGMPSLVYDGPFSSHMEQKESEMLRNEAEVDEVTAMRNALEFLSLDEGQLRLSHRSDGRIPSYSFIGHLDGGEVDIEVSRKGGYVISMLNTVESQGEETLAPEDAVVIADDFLREKGYANMTHSYHQNMGDFLLINYHYTQDGVACYPDLLKVGVSPETGKVLRFECRGYLQNHIPDRQIPTAQITAQEAEDSAMVGDLHLENRREVLIPTPGGELPCYELLCVTDDGTHVLVYVNTQTGMEEKILILLEDDKGTLAI